MEWVAGFRGPAAAWGHQWHHRDGQQPVMVAADDAAALSLGNMPLGSATCAAAGQQTAH
ncbi:hypothetical protein HaLaN_03346 [Haematococcus lacustris]|uniref:Uncharacterized protein n=1 Tax=Haematococcus lacustris TaxID=44745 RepID=A0A699YGQ1_HAELA|nr:hypothetical protein HaLaN_03346 [Haematococcus lacustris]